MKLTETVQTADWKAEKHVPFLEAKREGNLLHIKAFVGEEIAHPNTLEHHIAWIKVFFKELNSQLKLVLMNLRLMAKMKSSQFQK